MKRSDIPKEKRTFLGIDPEASGGLALVGYYNDLTPMPLSEASIWQWFALLPDGIYMTCIEKVGGFVAKDMGQSGMGPSMFAFGKQYGALLMALEAKGLRYDTVTPQKWQGFMRFTRDSCESQTQFKTRMRDEARRLYPNLHITKGTSDALLIATYCKLVWGS